MKRQILKVLCLSLLFATFTVADANDEGKEPGPRKVHGRHHHGPPPHFQEMKACMESKGIALPKHDPEGPRPKLTEEQRSAMKACKAEIRAKMKAEQGDVTE